MSERPAPSTTDDTRVIVWSIVGTGIGLATLLLMLAGLMIQQNPAAGSTARTFRIRR